MGTYSDQQVDQQVDQLGDEWNELPPFCTTFGKSCILNALYIFVAVLSPIFSFKYANKSGPVEPSNPRIQFLFTCVQILLIFLNEMDIGVNIFISFTNNG